MTIPTKEKPRDGPTTIVDFMTATEEDVDEITEFLRRGFVSEEPHGKAVGMDYECSAGIRELVVRSVQEPFSIKVTDKITGKIVAVRLHSVGRREENPGKFMLNDQKPDERDPRTQWIGKLITSIKSQFYSLVDDGVQKVIRREISYVDPKYQRKGIAQHFLWLGLDFDKLRAQGFHGIVSESASLANQTLLTKNGFVELARTDSRDYIFQGKPVVMPDGTNAMILMFKDIRNH